MQRIKELPSRIGEEVVLQGWLMNARSSGKIAFLQIRDGSGTPVDVTSDNYNEIINLPGQNPIIYDNDREIYDLLGTPNGVLGFAGVLRTDGAGTITQAHAEV